MIVGGIHSDFGDWGGYARAGATVGTAALLHPAPGTFPFLYLPAFAWVFAPLGHATFAIGYAINAFAMAACAAGAALILASVYGIRRAPALLLAAAWSPTLYSIAIGQTSNLGLLLVAVSTYGLARGSVALAAIPAALLLFKPTYAIPLFALMALRLRLREIALAVGVALPLYALSALAAAGDWRWPAAWLAGVVAWLPADNLHSSAKIITSTTVLAFHGGSTQDALFIVVAVAVAIPLAVRLPIAEACALVLAMGIAFSPHALTYDAVLLLPLLFVATTRLREPLRTRALGAVYLLAAVAPYADLMGVNSLRFVIPLCVFGWMAVRYRPRRAPSLTVDVSSDAG